MPWPIEGDYFEAVQNPSFCFLDPDLRSGTVKTTPLGLPIPITGAFASVYQVNGGGRRWAVRCFLREFADQQRRYAAISNHLRAAHVPAMVAFEYLQQGIRLKGQWYPILKMEWIESEPLDRFVARHVGQPHTLQALTRQWIDLMGTLRRAQIAHGDLQHGNVLVSNGALRLIDYDGMYVPELAGGSSHEEGHRNYQHPSRTGHDFGPDLDNFSAWVIFYSLTALSVEPRLWQLLDGGDEHLLFRREDYQHPGHSKVFQALDRSGKGELQALSAHFRSLLSLPLHRIPALDGAMVGSASPPTTRPATGLPEWLSDQVRQSETAPSALLADRHEEEGKPVAGAEWLADQLLADKTLPMVALGGRPWPERFLCYLVLLLVSAAIAATLLHLVRAVIAVPLIVVAPPGLISVLYWRFRSLRLVAERRIAVLKQARIERSIAQAERAMREVREQKKNVMAALSKLDGQYRGISKALDAELAIVRTGFDKFLGKLAGQRSDLDTNETAEVKSACAKIQGTLNQLLQQRNSLDQAETVAIQEAVERVKRQHIDQALSNAWIVSADLGGIGPRLKARLQAVGIVSAANVSRSAVQRVDGIGPAKANALQMWRLQVEQQATASAPRTLPYAMESQIRGTYTARRQALDAQIWTTRQQEQVVRREILDRFAQRRASLDKDERDARAEYERQSQAVRVKWRQEQDRLRREFEAVKIRVEAERKQFDAQMTELNRQIFQDRLKQYEARRDLARFRNISFPSFLKRSFSLRRAA